MRVGGQRCLPHPGREQHGGCPGVVIAQQEELLCTAELATSSASYFGLWGLKA